MRVGATRAPEELALEMEPRQSPGEPSVVENHRGPSPQPSPTTREQQSALEETGPLDISGASLPDT